MVLAPCQDTLFHPGSPWSTSPLHPRVPTREAGPLLPCIEGGGCRLCSGPGRLIFSVGALENLTLVRCTSAIPKQQAFSFGGGAPHDALHPHTPQHRHILHSPQRPFMPPLQSKCPPICHFNQSLQPSFKVEIFLPPKDKGLGGWGGVISFIQVHCACIIPGLPSGMFFP